MNNKDCFILSMILNPMIQFEYSSYDSFDFGKTKINVIVHHVSNNYASIEVVMESYKRKVSAFGTIHFDNINDYNKCKNQLISIREKATKKINALLFGKINKRLSMSLLNANQI